MKETFVFLYDFIYPIQRDICLSEYATPNFPRKCYNKKNIFIIKHATLTVILHFPFSILWLQNSSNHATLSMHAIVAFLDKEAQIIRTLEYLYILYKRINFTNFSSLSSSNISMQTYFTWTGVFDFCSLFFCAWSWQNNTVQ